MTIAQWLDRLPEPIREQALYYYGLDSDDKHSNLMSYSTFYLALKSAFGWAETEQGYDYWEAIASTMLQSNTPTELTPTV